VKKFLAVYTGNPAAMARWTSMMKRRERVSRHWELQRGING